jgi:hypothetical protein
VLLDGNIEVVDYILDQERSQSVEDIAMEAFPLVEKGASPAFKFLANCSRQQPNFCGIGKESANSFTLPGKG